MNFAFYIARYGNWQDKTISYCTRGPFSHVEVVFSNGDYFSSSIRDGGTRFKRIEYSEDWRMVSFKPACPESEIYDWCNTQLGLKYDTLGVIGLSMGLNLTNKRRKWYCSELCSFIAKTFGEIKTRTNISPNKFYSILLG